MPYLMHICFDNSSLLPRNMYYLEYKGIRFKLIQNNIYKWADVLITIVPHNNRRKEEEEAYQAASEFLSAMAWRNESRVKMWHAGGFGIRNEYKLKNAKCRVFDIHRTPLVGYYGEGYDISKIPEIESEEQRNALILFREANSSNNMYLSFLFYWQILETGGTKAIGWVDSTYKKKFNKLRVQQDDIDKLPLAGRTLGNYFNDDCRNAIAHIKRKSKGKTSIRLDKADDNTRIAISTRVIKEFARAYIIEHLKLNKRMYLVRKKGKGVPVYVRERDLRKGLYSIAYQRSQAWPIGKKQRRMGWK